jgi:N-formylglutamate amidohydrolase
LRSARFTDHYTDELFDIREPEFATVVFPVSRFVVDPERFEDDGQEPMAERGQGVIYTRTTDDRPLRIPPTAAEREALLDRYYRPHHAQLTRLVEEALANHGQALIIDGHSFPSRPLPVDLDQCPTRPDICIGTDGFHTPPQLVEALIDACAEFGWSVAVDRPNAGTLVPTQHWGKDERVSSVMIEVNRRLYLENEARDVSKAASWASVRNRIREVVRCAVAARH